MGRARFDARSIGVLITSNLFGGVGVASGVAVGALLVEQLGGTSVAGLGQAASVLGAAIAAVPLATMATRRGRRWSLALGYAIALFGGSLIIIAAIVSQLVVLLAGLGLFGVAQAVNLQSRYAAADGATPANRAQAMSVVIWATTVGSVAGPNLTAVGERLGPQFGVPGLAGPYLFSVLSFTAAATAIAVFFRPAAPAGRQAPDISGDAAKTERALSALAALRWAAGHTVARFAVVLIAVAHATMVMVMVMTPLHMQHHGMSLELVGIVISLHVLGMFAFSPVIGWLADRFGATRIALAGMVVLATAIALGFIAASAAAGRTLTAVALTVLGLGWSACMISASALLASTSSARVRVPLQGATDAGMNYAGAAAAALAGPILAFGGFRAVNLAAAVILVPAVVAAVGVLRGQGLETPDETVGDDTALATGVLDPIAVEPSSGPR